MLGVRTPRMRDTDIDLQAATVRSGAHRTAAQCQQAGDEMQRRIQ